MKLMFGQCFLQDYAEFIHERFKLQFVINFKSEKSMNIKTLLRLENFFLNF